MSGARYPVATIAEVVSGTLSAATASGEDLIEQLLIDSRGATITNTTLFIALRGPRHDGHRYIADLIARGARHFLVMDEPDAALVGKANFIRVADTLAALQHLAAWHRSHFTCPVIGITGSNGKTIVKEWLFQMLRGEERIVRSPASWNSQVGVPLSVWQMGAEHTLGIFEAGISKPGEMEKLEPIIRPTIGVLTNIGDAHDEGFKDRGGDAKAIEKLKLFPHAEVWIHPNDRSELDKLHYLLPNVQHKEWSMVGHGGVADFVRVVSCDIVGEATRIRLEHQGTERTFAIPFTDDASLENALTCITVCLHLGRTAQWINGRLALLEPVDMRMRTLQGTHGTTLIDDSYSMDENSLAMAMAYVQRAAHGRDRVLVISDVPESERSQEQLYAAVARTLAPERLDGSGGKPVRVIGVGPAIHAQRDKFPVGSRFYPDVDTLLQREDPKDFPGTVVLIKGARRFGFERIVERWQEQVHGTELEIDLEAIRHNLNHYRALLPRGVRTMAMVKAFGYGTGALELARLFAHEQVHYLGVAYADEGIELRQQGITTPIMVMNPEPVAMETLHRFELEPEVYDPASLRSVMAYRQAAGSCPPVHIKLDTGMHRLGFTEAELPRLLEALREQRGVKVASILSHLVGSEDPALDEFTREQIAAFTRMADAIDGVLGYRPLRHIANSAGIARWPSAHFDMVRVGIGLHGIGVDATETAQLMPAAALRSPIAQLKQLRTGDTVGYGRRGVVAGDRVIATLPIGYADGLSRRLGNGVGRLWIAGQPAPIIGNVCMDMCMVDVTGIPCTVGDLAVVFDAKHPISDVARDMGTIPYEVLTSISQRVKRVYVRG